MSEIVIVATITPAEGKADRVNKPLHPPSQVYLPQTLLTNHTTPQLEELLTTMANAVHASEPEVLRYQLHRQTGAEGTPVFVMLET